MNQQIKQRIIQLNNDEIPSGYKNTEFGVFPCDWETKQLAQLLDFKNGVNADKDKYNSGIKMISVNDILTDRPIVYDSIQGQVDIDEDKLKEYGVTYGDILFQRSSETFEDSGKSNVYLDHDKTATYSGFVIRGKKKAEYEPYYLNEALRIGQVRKQIVRHAAGSQHINVGQDSLASVSVPFATLQEQSRIAEILMTWDKAIELQETMIDKLVAKKHSIIQCCFASEKCNTIIRFVDYIVEKSERNATKCTHIMSISNTHGFIDQEEQFSKQVASENVSQYKIVKKNYVAYNPSRINVGSIAVYEKEEIGIISPMYTVFECNGIDPRFFLLILNTDRGKYEIKSRLAGSVRDSLAFDELQDIKMNVPDPKEWEKIINIFELFNKTIQLEKDKLDLLKQQRKALQQYLLNGIVRV